MSSSASTTRWSRATDLQDTATSVPNVKTHQIPVIRDPSAFRACLRRLRDANETVIFTNPHRLKILIRNDPTATEAGHFAFDVSFVSEDDPAVQRAAKNEIDMYEDGSGCAVADEYNFAEDDDDALAKAMDLINSLHSWSMCPCGSYFIKDGDPHMCLYCELTRSAEDLAGIFCPICHDAGFPRWMHRASCCGQLLHRACRDACVSAAAGGGHQPRCPLCRAEWDE